MSMKRDDVAELIAAAQFLLQRRDTEANYYGRVLAEIAKRQLDADAAAEQRIAELEKDSRNHRCIIERLVTALHVATIRAQPEKTHAEVQDEIKRLVGPFEFGTVYDEIDADEQKPNAA
jgi:hypothetical protein